MDDFKTKFNELTGTAPFPWQCDLFDRFCSNDVPGACVIPTGLGKTSVIAIWLLAREINSKLPRRLVYVVNRRTVVDQTSDEVKKLKDNLFKIGKKPEDLAISTLRGQYADNREWSADPSREAVICGTIDMIGSRLLFSGYGIGFKQRPLHAAFLAQDALIVHDEAHLEQPFQELISRLESEQKRFAGTVVATKLRVMALTATPRGTTNVFGITDKDRNDATISQRLGAVKRLTLDPVGKDAEVAAKIVDQAFAFQPSGRAVLIFVRTVEQVKKVVDGLVRKKIDRDCIAQLTGTIRGLERDKLVETSVFKRFLANAVADRTSTVYLVCTSAGEVGVNISADDLVCDLSTFESMAQRFGRINRFGKQPDSTVTVVHTTEFDEKRQYEVRRERTLALLQQLTSIASVNPNALDTLDKAEREKAFSETPTMVEISDILLDAWSMTSIRNRIPGRPDVETFLHGIAEEEQPETHVAWREEVTAITPDMFGEYPPQDLLELYPLKPHELLRDRSKRVFTELQLLAEHFGERRVWVVDSYGVVDASRTLAMLTSRDESLIAGKTVVLPHDIGGLSQQGMLDGSIVEPNQDGPLTYARNNDVADVILDTDDKPLRVRIDNNKNAAPDMMRLIQTIKWTEDEESETESDPRKSFWFEKLVITESSRHAMRPVLLDVHTSDVESKIAEILSRLTLDPWIDTALKLAAKWHDLGKCRERWQLGIGRPDKWKDKWFAKSGRKWVTRREGQYRHELGSLLDVSQFDEFKQLDARTQDLVLHLIATHHGMARPHFESNQTIDSNHPEERSTEMSIETVRRFARLQRTFGHWGLAYLESILRAADWHASANPTEYFEEVAS